MIYLKTLNLRVIFQENTMSENVLLNLDSEPRFDAISAADIEPAMTEAMNLSLIHI